MHYARITNNNYLIWNYITKNIQLVLSNPKFESNPFILSDLSYAFSTYNTSLLAENDQNLEQFGKNCENFENSLYIKNAKVIWDLIENQIVSNAKFLDVTYLTNLMIDISQIEFDMKKSWALLTNNFREFLSKDLYDKHIISSPFLFKIAVIMMGSQRVLFAGDYRFTKSQNSFLIAYRMTRGIQGLPKIKVTIPEGTNVYDMAYIYMTKLPNFNAPYFVSKAIKYEGYLFPDTYYFLSNADTDEIIKTMKANFDTKIKTIEGDIKAFNKPIKDIIIK